MEDRGILQVAHSLPYSDVDDLEREELERLIKNNEPVEFSHTLEELIVSQLKAGFVITNFYENARDACEDDPRSRYMQPFFTTHANPLNRLKPKEKV